MKWTRWQTLTSTVIIPGTWRISKFKYERKKLPGKIRSDAKTIQPTLKVVSDLTDAIVDGGSMDEGERIQAKRKMIRFLKVCPVRTFCKFSP